jgi:hypothetical protein
MSWLSKQLNKSKKKGTGIFSWGESDYAKVLDIYVPGAGTALDAGLDKLASGEVGKTQVDANEVINTASFFNNNQLAIFALIGIGIYRILQK